MTIRARLVIFSTLVFAVVLCVFALLLDRSVTSGELTKLDARLESHADKVATEIEEQEHEPLFPDARAFMELHTDGLPKVSLQIFDSAGRALLPGTETSIHGEETPGIRSAVIGGHTFRIFMVRSEPNEKGVYLIQVSAPATEMEERLAALHQFLLFGLPFSILLTAVGASLIVRASFKPISAIVDATTSISGANLVGRVPVPAANDEVRHLANTLNDMISRLESSFTAQKRFIADASHEIRTPLTVISAELEYLRAQVRDRELNELGESANTALEEVDRLVRLSNSLLLLARLDADREPLLLTSVRFDELLAGCIAKAKSIAYAKSISIRLLVDEPAEIQTDADKCIMIVMNLLDNAIKYSNPGTTVSLELQSSSNAIQLTIADEGIGIPQSELRNIFDRFYRIDQSRNSVRGTGLGLAIVQRLVSLLNGSIRVESLTSPSDGPTNRVQTGTTIVLTFPRS